MKLSTSSILSLVLALNGAIASPLRARDYAVVTVTEVATEIVHVTSTTWVDPAQYTPTTVPTTDTNPYEKDKNKDENHVTTNTPSTTLSIPSTSVSSVSTTISTPSTSIPTTTSLPTTTSIPTTTSELPTSTPTLYPTSISVPTSTQAPPTTLETSTLPALPTIISTPPAVKTETPTTAPAPVPSAPSPKAPDTSSSNTGGTSYSGEATFYDPGLGSCGIVSSNSDFIAAISHTLYDSKKTADPNKNPFCGTTILCSYKGGPEVPVKVVDRCEGCKEGDLDFSMAAFKALGINPDAGRVPISWHFA